MSAEEENVLSSSRHSVYCFVCHILLTPPYLQCEECLEYSHEYLKPMENGFISTAKRTESFHCDDFSNVVGSSVDNNEDTQYYKQSKDHEFTACDDTRFIEYHDSDEELVTMETMHTEPIALSSSQQQNGVPAMNNIGICLLCFRSGETKMPHQSDHSYSFVRDDFPLFVKSSWTAKEEGKLISAVQDYGLGNWKEISKYLFNRSPKDCEKHYNAFYINGYNYNMPVSRQMLPDMYGSQAIPYTHVIAAEPPRPGVNSVASSRLAGYMAARGDFITEHDNLAEFLVCDISFDSDDTPVDKEVKLSMVQQYVDRVKEREIRKKIIKKYGLIHPTRTEAYYRNLQKEMCPTVVAVLRKCMRLLEPIDFDYFVEVLLVERRLQQQIRKLQEYRREGLTRQQHIRVFERLKASRLVMSQKKTALSNVMRNLQDKDTWHSWIQKTAVADKIASGGSVPHPALSRRQAPPLDIQGMPGVEKLTNEEKELCSSVRLLPAAYSEFREVLVNEYKKEGKLRLAKARTLIKIDVNKTRKIYDFLLRHAVISQ